MNKFELPKPEQGTCDSSNSFQDIGNDQTKVQRTQRKQLHSNLKPITTQ